MFYFKRNIGDYHKKAGRLSMLEHGAYTLLMDACYDREVFPTLEQAIDWCWARTALEVEAVQFVLSKFFTLIDDHFVQQQIKDDLQAFHGMADKNKQIALDREEKRRSQKARSVHDSEPTVQERAPTVNETPPNQEPITKNHKPKNTVGGAKRRTQLPVNFEPSENGKQKAEGKGLLVSDELPRFCDFHRAKGSVMADWQAAWRTWVSNARSPLADQRPGHLGETAHQRTMRRNYEVLTGSGSSQTVDAEVSHVTTIAMG